MPLLANQSTGGLCPLRLLYFFMRDMLPAKATILFHFQTIRIVVLVFHR
jgi:hypothetical protein